MPLNLHINYLFMSLFKAKLTTKYKLYNYDNVKMQCTNIKFKITISIIINILLKLSFI